MTSKIPIVQGEDINRPIEGGDVIDSNLIGFYREGGDSMRTAQDKLGDVRNILDYDTSTPPSSDPSGRFAKAFTDLADVGGGALDIGQCDLTFSVGQSVPAGVVVRGAGMGVTKLSYAGSGFAFSTLNAPGAKEVDAPHYKDFSLTSPNGVQLNSPDGGFVDGSTSQAYMMRHEISNVEFIAAKAQSGSGVQYSKCFDGRISGCRFSNYDVQIDSYGSDLCSISGKTTRLQGSSTAAIRVASIGSFGSQLRIDHVEILAMQGGVAVDSSDRMLIVGNLYVEQATMPEGGQPLQAVIRLRGGYTFALENLRCEVPVAYCPNWLVVDRPMVNIDIANVTTTGVQQYGPALFPTDGAKYY